MLYIVLLIDYTYGAGNYECWPLAIASMQYSETLQCS